MTRLCPSATPEAGHLLIGRVSDGRVVMATTPMVATEAFATAIADASEERHFRFAAPCRQKACGHWSGRCTVLDRLSFEPQATPGTEVACAIRAQCRWHHERGSSACGDCTRVVRAGLLQSSN